MTNCFDREENCDYDYYDSNYQDFIDEGINSFDSTISFNQLSHRQEDIRFYHEEGQVNDFDRIEYHFDGHSFDQEPFILGIKQFNN